MTFAEIVHIFYKEAMEIRDQEEVIKRLTGSHKTLEKLTIKELDQIKESHNAVIKIIQNIRVTKEVERKRQEQKQKQEQQAKERQGETESGCIIS